MNARWHHVVAGLGLALAGTLLTGCHAQGTFDVLSEERVAVDLFVSGADVNCPNAADALKLTVTSTVDQYGDEVCHVTGETQATYFSPFGITVSPAAEYLVLQANLSGGIDSWPAADIDIRFPGKVMDASLGSVSDNVVRITDLGALTQGSGLHAVGLASPGPPQWMIAAAAGAGAGILVTLIAGLAVVLVRRSRHRTRARLDDTAFPDAVPGPDAASTADRPVTVAPVESGPAAATGPPSPPVDTSWLARPPAAIEAANGKTANGAGTNGAGTSRAGADGAGAEGAGAEGAGTEGAGTDAAQAHGVRTAPRLQRSDWARPPDASDDQTAG